MTVLRLDGAPKCSWGTDSFAVDSIEIVGEGRYVVHEYPHQDGGDVEKLGRKLYVIRVHAIFDEGFRGYPGNYPGTINKIIERAELSQSARLVLPNAGSINAFLTKWPRKWTAQVRSGEAMDLEFLEDEVINDIDTFSANASYDKVDAAMNDLARFTPLAPSVPTSLWDKLQNSVNALMVIRDRASREALLVESHVESIRMVAGQIDKFITTPIGYPVVLSLIALVDASANLLTDASPTKIALRYWTVPKAMDVLTVSRLLYGKTTRAMDLLDLNPIEDAMLIPAGFSIRYFPELAT